MATGGERDKSVDETLVCDIQMKATEHVVQFTFIVVLTIKSPLRYQF